MSYVEGATVLAIRDSDEVNLYVYGEGVYVGNRPRPGMPDTPSEDDRRWIENTLHEDDAPPVEQHPRVRLVQANVDGLVVPPERLGQVVAEIRAERARPFEERVLAWYRDMIANPCIYLDSGDLVWGMQCWWGDRDATMAQFTGKTIVQVPVPEGNGRWRE